MARYRYHASIPGQPRSRVERTRKSMCQLCIISDAMKLRRKISQAWQVPLNDVIYTVEVLAGAPGQWEIKWTEKMSQDPLIERHGHG